MTRILRWSALLLLLLTLPITASSAGQETRLDVTKHVLKNGMTLLLVERHTAPVFYSYTYFKVGSANEVGGIIGAAHLLEHMMFKGTRDIGTSDWQRESTLMNLEDDLYQRLYQAEGETENLQFQNDILGLDIEDNSAAIAAIRDSIAEVQRQIAEVVVQNELEEVYSTNGAYGFNAGTGYDMTSYVVAFPKNRLELLMMIESERLKNPVFREFYTERNVVIEERRLKVDTQGPAKLFEQLIATAFVAHPYQIFWEWESEVANLTRAEIADYFKRYYSPGRTVMAIVGDIDVEQTIAMADKYFDDIPAQAPPNRIETVEPPQIGEKRVIVKFDAEPELNIAYHKTSYAEPDDVVFRIIERLLSSGRTSRFYKNLVEGKRLALYAETSQFPGGAAGSLDPNLLIVDAAPKAPATCADLETAIYEEIDKLKTVPVDSLELEKIKNNLVAEFVWGMYSGFGLADKLAEFEATAGDWRYVNKLQEKMAAVTAEDIMRVAKKYFTEDNRTVAILEPVREEASHE
ncbi:MAG: insulinase family protein [candidate division Zixibacteria bacterium]|nr:insulinase family protein [candidate division Zixibacteria bacterium]